MPQLTFIPASDLRAYISHYMTVEINTVAIHNDILCTYPDGICVMCIFYSREVPEFVIAGKTVKGTRGFACGLLNAGIMLHKPGDYKCIITFFKPMGSYELFQIAPAKYQNTLVDLADLLGKDGAEIVEKINDVKSTATKIDLLNSFFRRYDINCKTGKYLCKQLVSEIFASNGRMKVDELVKKFKISSRHVDRLFQQNLGVTPKHYQRLVRLGTAYKMLTSERINSIYDVVYDAGYYDQAHMTHDFDSYADITPNDLLQRKENTLFPYLLTCPFAKKNSGTCSII